MIFTKPFIKTAGPTGFDELTTPDWFLGKNHHEREDGPLTQITHLETHFKTPPLLPIELWELIFVFTFPTTPQSRIDTSVAPFLLLHVCSAWRAIVLDSPRIWALLPTLKTTAWHGRGRDEARLGSMLDIFLTQSAQAPSPDALTSSIRTKNKVYSMNTLTKQASVTIPQLTLIAGSEYQAYRSPSSRLTPIWDVILPHFSRLKHVRLHLPETAIIPLLGSKSDSFVHLESLAIEVHPEALPQTTHTFTLEHAPRLRRIILSHITFNFRTLHIPFKQLVELKIVPQVWAKAEVYPTLDECLSILDEAEKLKTVEMVLEDDIQDHAERKIRSGIQEMNLSVRDSDNTLRAQSASALVLPLSRRHDRLAQFLDSIDAHSLQTLTIGNSSNNSSGTDMFPFEAFHSFLSRSASGLRHLHLVHAPMSEIQLTDCLRRVPNLQTLVVEARDVGPVNDTGVGDVLLGALTCNAPVLVPSLQALEFRHCTKRCAQPALLNMLNTRLRLGLKTFKANVSLGEMTIIEEASTVWREQGLVVELARSVNVIERAV